MKQRTARVLKYVTTGVGLLVFVNIFFILYKEPILLGFGENRWGVSQEHKPPHLEPATSVSIPRIEVLHVGFVVQSHSDCRHASLQVKSLLMHIHNPLHLHYLTSSTLAVILRTLIDTWNIPHLNVSFYPIDEVPDLLATNDLKLMLPAFVPEAIHKLAILDPDIIVGSDITVLWQEFRMMRKKRKALGVLADTFNGKLDTRMMLVNVPAIRGINLFRGFAPIMKEGSVYRSMSTWNLNSYCWRHKVALLCLKVVSQRNSDSTLEEVISYNGYRLQTVNLTTDSLDMEYWLNLSCSDMRRHMTYFRVHPYFIKYSYHPLDNADVSLVTHLSFNRIHMLVRILELWEGPVSAAIYVEELQVFQLMELIRNESVFQRTNIGVHIVYKKGGLFYPINFLRNVAWNYSTTPYLFLNDVDLLPSLDLYVQLKDALRTTLRVNSVYVVPAFETPIKDLQLPTSKQTLQQYVNDEQASPFKWQTHKLGHGPTNYSKWLEATEPYEVRWKKWYEPYIVVHHNATRYDERFVGYGRNKVSHILELHVQHYHFIVLPNVYVIHYPHQPAWDEIKYREKVVKADGSIANSRYLSCIGQIQNDFCRDLMKKYGLSSCERDEPTPI